EITYFGQNKSTNRVLIGALVLTSSVSLTRAAYLWIHYRRPPRIGYRVPVVTWYLVPGAACAPATHGAEAIGAVDRSVTTRHEGDLGLLAAVGANNLGHGALRAAIATAAAVAAITVAVAAAVAIAIAPAGARGLLGRAARRAAHRLAVAL